MGREGLQIVIRNAWKIRFGGTGGGGELERGKSATGLSAFDRRFFWFWEVL